MNLATIKVTLPELIGRYQSQADFISIRLEQSEGTQISLRSDQVETLSEGIAMGGQVRVCHQGGWGFASFNRWEQLRQRLEEAIAAARLIGDDETLLAPIDPVQQTFINPLTGKDPRQISLADKKALCDHYNDLLRGTSDKITTTHVRYSDSQQTVLLATSEGTLLEQCWWDLEMRFAATAKDGNGVQVGRETTGSRRGYGDLENLDQVVQGAAQRAVKALTLPTVQGKTYPVVIDPILTGLFVHEAFGHLSEADMLYENPDFLEVMSLGRRFGPPELQIFD